MSIFHFKAIDLIFNDKSYSDCAFSEPDLYHKHVIKENVSRSIYESLKGDNVISLIDKDIINEFCIYLSLDMHSIILKQYIKYSEQSRLCNEFGEVFVNSICKNNLLSLTGVKKTLVNMSIDDCIDAIHLVSSHIKNKLFENIEYEFTKGVFLCDNIPFSEFSISNLESKYIKNLLWSWFLKTYYPYLYSELYKWR